VADEIVSELIEAQEPAGEYERPRIEAVLTAEGLAREIQYAGGLSD
jgi:hypothetical protein